MHNDALDDAGPPYDPATPEEFVLRGEEAFQSWWGELVPPESYKGVSLDPYSSQLVWRAVYEHQSLILAMLYDCAEGHGGRIKAVAEIELGYVVDRYHHGEVSFPLSDFIDWMAKYEDRVCRNLDEDETLHFWIAPDNETPGSATQENGAACGVGSPAVYPTDREALAEEQFQDWWQGLDPPASLGGIPLDFAAARVVWHAAFLYLSDAVETVYDSAKAHAGVAEDTALLELGYLIHRYHGGAIALPLDDVMDWTGTHEDRIQRDRDESSVTIRILPCD